MLIRHGDRVAVSGRDLVQVGEALHEGSAVRDHGSRACRSQRKDCDWLARRRQHIDALVMP